MHDSVYAWVGRQVDEFGLSELRTLELGSRNYNGTVRPHFTGAYHGIDMEEGRDVDIVAKASDIPFGDNSFEVVVSTEMLEHDPSFWLTFREVRRVLRPGGFFIVTTRGIGFPYHEYPGDYWRFTQDALRLLFRGARLEELKVEDDPQEGHSGVFGVARKPLTGAVLGN